MIAVLQNAKTYVPGVVWGFGNVSCENFVSKYHLVLVDYICHDTESCLGGMKSTILIFPIPNNDQGRKPIDCTSYFLVGCALTGQKVLDE